MYFSGLWKIHQTSYLSIQRMPLSWATSHCNLILVSRVFALLGHPTSCPFEKIFLNEKEDLRELLPTSTLHFSITIKNFNQLDCAFKYWQPISKSLLRASGLPWLYQLFRRIYLRLLCFSHKDVLFKSPRMGSLQSLSAPFKI